MSSAARRGCAGARGWNSSPRPRRATSSSCRRMCRTRRSTPARRAAGMRAGAQRQRGGGGQHHRCRPGREARSRVLGRPDPQAPIAGTGLGDWPARSNGSAAGPLLDVKPQLVLPTPFRQVAGSTALCTPGQAAPLRRGGRFVPFKGGDDHVHSLCVPPLNRFVIGPEGCPRRRQGNKCRSVIGWTRLRAPQPAATHTGRSE